MDEGISTYISQLRSSEGMPWTDWMTKHVIDTYGSARSVGALNARPEDIVQIKENLR